MSEKSFYASVIFIVSHLFGIIAGINMLPTEVSVGNQVLNQSPISGLYMVGLIILATGLMLLLLYWNRKLLIKIWFNLAILITTYIFFASFMKPLNATGPAFALLLVRAMAPDYGIRNLVDVFTYAGAGALFGTMLGVVPSLIFLLVLGVYDILSVFYTGHMVDLAVKTLDTDSFMGIMLPEEEVKTKDIDYEEDVETENSVNIGVVGGGDIIGPMVLSVSLLKILPVWSAVMTSIGSMFGLYFLMEKMEDNRFYPAIPFVAGGAIIGLALSLIFV